MRSDASLNLDLGGLLKSLALLLSAHVGLGTHDATAPLPPGALVLVHEAILDGGNELGELRLVLRADLGEGDDSSSLLVNDSAEAGLALDDSVRNTHLLAEGRKEDNELNRVDIVGDEDERSLLVLDQTDNVVETILGSVGLLGNILLLLALLDSSSLLQETLLLLGLGLRAVLVEELESLGGGVLVEDVLELGKSRRNLQTHLKDLLLALEADILGPLDHTAHVTLGLDILTDAEVTAALLNQRVLRSLLRASLSLGERGRGDLLAGFGGLSLRKEDISDLLQAKKSSLNSSESDTVPSSHQGLSAPDQRQNRAQLQPSLHHAKKVSILVCENRVSSRRGRNIPSSEASPEDEPNAGGGIGRSSIAHKSPVESQHCGH